MFRHRRRVAAIVCTLIVAGALRAEAAWTQVETPNFVVIGNASEGRLRDAAERLEVFRGVLAALFPPTTARPPRVTVVAFNSQRSFGPYRPLFNGKPIELAGYFMRSGDRVYLLLGDVLDDAAFKTVYHEYAHYVTSTVLKRAPAWVSEGIAELYETFEVSGRNATIGRPNDYHAQYLQPATLLPIRQMIAIDRDSSIYNKESHQRGVFYSQSWALMHYLVFGSEQRRGQLQQYLAAFEGGMSSEAALRAAFGDEKVLDAEMRNYIRGTTLPAVRVRFAEKLDAGTIAKGRLIDDAEAEGHLGDVLATMNRPADARKQFDKALVRRPDAVTPAVGLGRLMLREGNVDEAVKILEPVATRAADSLDAQLTLARALIESANAKGDDATIVAKARAPLTRAVALDPAAAEPAGLLAWVELRTDGDIPKAIPLLERAIALAPDREDFRLFLAEALVRTREFDRATSYLGPLMGSGKTDEVRSAARRMLTYVADMKQPARTAAPSPTAPPLAAPDLGARGVSVARTPTIILDLRRVEAGEQRVLGMFTGVECQANGGALVVETSGATLRLAVAKLDQVQFISYRQDTPGSIGCGSFPTAHRVLATFKTSGDRREAVAIELLPDGYEPPN